MRGIPSDGGVNHRCLPVAPNNSEISGKPLIIPFRLAVVPEPDEGERVLSGHNDDDDGASAPIIIREQTSRSPEKVARGETGETLFDSEECASLRRSSRERRPASLTQYSDL